MSDEQTNFITLTVMSSDPTMLTRATEAMARCAAGLSLEGIYVSLSFGQPDSGDDDE